MWTIMPPAKHTNSLHLYSNKWQVPFWNQKGTCHKVKVYQPGFCFILGFSARLLNGIGHR